MLPAVLELVPNQSKYVEVDPHGELLVLDLRLLARCAHLSERVEVTCEETMEVEEVVSEIVVMRVSRSVVAILPDIGELLRRLRVLLVD